MREKDQSTNSLLGFSSSKNFSQENFSFAKVSRTRSCTILCDDRLLISSRSWVKNPRYKSKKTCSYTKVSMQDEQENNSRQVTTHGNRRTRTHLLSELSDGGQIKVVHFDTKICQGDFGCNERSFPEVMQKQWKRIIPFVCSSWCCLI